MSPNISKGQKRPLCYHISALTAVKSSMPQCGVRSSGAFLPGGLHAGLCRAFLAVFVCVVFLSCCLTGVRLSRVYPRSGCVYPMLGWVYSTRDYGDNYCTFRTEVSKHRRKLKSLRKSPNWPPTVRSRSNTGLVIEATTCSLYSC